MKQSIIWGLKKMGLPIAIVRCKEIDMAFIIDTGASDNCLSLDTYRYLTQNHNDVIKEKGEGNTILGIDYLEMNSRHVSLDFSIGRTKYTEDFLVFNVETAMEHFEDEFGITVSGILGNVFLVNNQIVIDYGDYTIHSKRKRKKKNEDAGKECA